MRRMCYICDRCHKQATNESLNGWATLEAWLTAGIGPTGKSTEQMKSAELCDECCESFRMFMLGGKVTLEVR